MIPILCSIDKNFVMQFMVTAVSLFRNNAGEEFHVHLLHIHLDEATLEKIRTFVEDTHHQRISFYDADEELMHNEHIPQTGRFTLSTYMRCFVTRILPADISKILYLDCDILVRGSIRPLWDTDLEGCALGAVDDMWALRDKFERLQIPPADSYFNNGVLLINLDFWRKIDTYALSLDYIEKHHDRIIHHDQDVFNALFHDRRKALPVQFNMQDAFYRRRRQWIQPALLPAIDAALENPVIVHFTGSHKPWEYKCYHPFRKEYQRYIDLTPYKGYSEAPKKFSDRIETIINPVLWTLHLAPRKYRM